MRNSSEFWDELAKEVGPDASVMDPRDRRGYKNRYIAALRDRAILNALSGISETARILDFGCGSGNLSRRLAENGYQSVGVDFSFDLVKHARQQGENGKTPFVLYDGRHLPFASNCFDVCVIYTVLQYLVDTKWFCQAVREINRVLKPGGRLIAIERTCPQKRPKPDELIHQRSSKEILTLLKEAGFQDRENYIVRRGHFPLIYLIRYGFIPTALFPSIIRTEAFLGKVFKNVRFDYAETMFISEKPLV